MYKMYAYEKYITCNISNNVSIYSPLWKQKVPNYPLYQQGGPQNRILLCYFWMKLIKPHREVPKNQVHFEVHPQ